MNYLWLYILLLSLYIKPSFGQQTYNVSGITGYALITGDVSPNQARKEALNNAKLSALQEAGITEQLNSYQVLYTSQQKNDYSQFFTSDIQTEIQGAIQSFEIIREKTYCKNEDEIVYDVMINATVIKYSTSPDVTFDAKVDGLRQIYNNDESLTFKIQATQPCYLTIFNITDTEALVLYPNKYERQVKCNAMQICQYPTAKIDYILHTDKNEAETNRLIFVFTKTPVPYIKMDDSQVTTPDHIFGWIYSIMPDQRKVEYLTLSIQK